MICCTSRPANYVEDRLYYFRVNSHNSPEAVALKSFLENEIPRYKYTITHGSGTNWPYYKQLQLDEQISFDSLMPPHSFVHKMVPYNKIYPVLKDEFVVQIDLFPLRDTFPNYNVSIFRQTADSLELSATSGIHFIMPGEFKTQSELSQKMLENILRYSFK